MAVPANPGPLYMGWILYLKNKFVSFKIYNYCKCVSTSVYIFENIIYEIFVKKEIL